MSNGTRTTRKGGTGQPDDRLARWVVGGVWAAMVLAALAGVVLIARNVPLAEDWLLVRPMTGNEPDLLGWFWAQNNEHRVPLPRALLLGLLTVTGGDFRAGMVFNIVVLGALSAAMVLVARRLRGGRTRLTDAFFPVLLLHLGNWENLVWSWQLSQVVPVVLACVLLLVFVSYRDPATPRATLIVGACLVMLPLCGANGLLFVPLPALWLVYCVFARPGRAPEIEGPGWVKPAALGAAAVGLALCGLYFIGYERPAWQPENPGVAPSVKAAIQFVTFGLGPAVQRAWTPAAAVALSVMLFSGLVVGAAVLRSTPAERRRAVGLLIFLVNMAAYVAAVGWGRAGVIADSGHWPLRYVLMAAPAFCAAYYAWVLYGPPRLRAAAQGFLLVAVLVLAPLNTRAGLGWGRWYHGGMRALEQDVAEGAPAAALAQRHGHFLVHWWSEDYLAATMRMLREREIGLFARLAADPPAEPTSPADE